MATAPDPACIQRTLRYFERLLRDIAAHGDDPDFIDGSFENLWESVQKSLKAMNEHQPSSMPKHRIARRTSEMMDRILDACPDDPGAPDFFLAYMEYDRVAANNLWEVLQQFESPDSAGEFLKLVRDAAQGFGDPTNLASQPYYRGLQTLCRSCSGNLGIKGTWYQMEILRELVDLAPGRWGDIDALEPFEASGTLLARGIDIVLKANHPGIPGGGRLGGRFLEVKSGPSLVPKQIARHFTNRPAAPDIAQIRFVINAGNPDEVRRAAAQVWNGLGKVFHGSPADNIPADPALARRVLADAGIALPAATNVGDALMDATVGSNYLDQLIHAYIINRPMRIPLRNP